MHAFNFCITLPAITSYALLFLYRVLFIFVFAFPFMTSCELFVLCIKFFLFLYRIACYYILWPFFSCSFHFCIAAMPSGPVLCIRFLSFLYRCVACYDLRQFHVWEFWKQSPPGKSDAQQKLPEFEFSKLCSENKSMNCSFDKIIEVRWSKADFRSRIHVERGVNI